MLIDRWLSSIVADLSVIKSAMQNALSEVVSAPSAQAHSRLPILSQRKRHVSQEALLDVGVTTPGTATCIPYVLVLVQEGYNANAITYPAVTDDMYNPTMNVLISG